MAPKRPEVSDNFLRGVRNTMMLFCVVAVGIAVFDTTFFSLLMVFIGLAVLFIILTLLDIRS